MPDVSSWRRVAVIVPTLNNAADLRHCLAALAAQTGCDATVVVVDSHSADETPVVARAAGAVYIDTDTTTRADACNEALRGCRAEIVAFTDDDCIPPKEWLATLVTHFGDPRVDAVGGPSFAPPEQGFLARAADVAMAARWFTAGTRYGRQGGSFTEIDHNSGCNAAYRRVALERAGGFPPGALGCEDLVLDARIRAAGMHIWYEPRAWTHHRRRSSFSALYRMGRSYGRGRALAGGIVPALVRPVHWLPTIAVIGALLLAGLALMAVPLLAIVPGVARPVSAAPLAAAALFYLVALIGCVLGGSPYRRRAELALAPVCLAVLLAGFGFGFLRTKTTGVAMRAGPAMGTTRKAAGR